MYAFFVNYALINFRSHNQYTISIDLLSIRISIRVSSIRISKQSKHRDQQAKGSRESGLSCIKNYALCCMRDRQRDRQTDRQTDRRTDGRTDGQFDYYRASRILMRDPETLARIIMVQRLHSIITYGCHSSYT